MLRERAEDLGERPAVDAARLAIAGHGERMPMHALATPGTRQESLGAPKGFLGRELERVNDAPRLDRYRH